MGSRCRTIARATSIATATTGAEIPKSRLRATFWKDQWLRLFRLSFKLPNSLIFRGRIDEFFELFVVFRVERNQRWREVGELAATQAGHFTTQQAADLGISAQVLTYRVATGALSRPMRGIFRLAGFPAGDNDSLVVLALWAGADACFSHTTALWLHRLSDALPSRAHITVSTSFSPRKNVPDGVILHRRDVWSDGTGWIGPLRVTTPYETIRDCLVDHADAIIIQQAIEQGFERGLLTKQEASALKRTGEKR